MKITIELTEREVEAIQYAIAFTEREHEGTGVWDVEVGDGIYERLGVALADGRGLR